MLHNVSLIMKTFYVKLCSWSNFYCCKTIHCHDTTCINNNNTKIAVICSECCTLNCNCKTLLMHIHHSLFIQMTNFLCPSKVFHENPRTAAAGVLTKHRTALQNYDKHGKNGWFKSRQRMGYITTNVIRISCKAFLISTVIIVTFSIAEVNARAPEETEIWMRSL